MNQRARRYTRITLITLLLVTAILGAALAGLHVYLNRCHECGHVGPWKRIDFLFIDGGYRKCECGAIQNHQQIFGFPSGSPTNLPPLRTATTADVESLKKLILENGGEKKTDFGGEVWYLFATEKGDVTRRHVESIVDLSKVSVLTLPEIVSDNVIPSIYEEDPLPFWGFSIAVPVDHQHVLILAWSDLTANQAMRRPKATVGKPLHSITLRLIPEGSDWYLLRFVNGGQRWSNDFR